MTTQNEPLTEPGELTAAPRNFQIPGCQVTICSDEDGVTVEELLAIAFNLASSNPGAILDFGITVRGE